MDDNKKRDYTDLKREVDDMRIEGFKYIGNGRASFRGQEIDLTATPPNNLAIAYTTLSQIKL